MTQKSLFISSWAPPMIGGPMNLYNLLSQLPPETYGLYTGYRALTTTAHDDRFWLSCPYYFYDVPNAKKTVGNLPSDQPKAVRQRSGFVHTVLNFPIIFHAFSIVDFFAKLLVIWFRGVRLVRREKFTILIGISGEGLALIATRLIALTCRIPYSVYLFDLYRGNNFGWFLNAIARMAEPSLVKNAKRCIVTNEGTADLYRKRYNVSNLVVLHNAVFPEKYSREKVAYAPRPPYTITFTGHIYWAQEQAVQNLIAAMAMLEDMPVQLKLYCPNPPGSIKKAILNKKNIWLGAAAPEEMPAIQSAATLLFLPLAWHTAAPEIIATATPGKFTDYLASGRPILVHAPDYAYVSQYARSNALGLVVDQDDPRKLAENIRAFLQHPTQGSAYVENALRIFSQNHDARKNARELVNALNMV